MSTPKERFLVSGHAKAFELIRGSEAFEVACDYALLQLQSEMPASHSPGMPTDPYVGICCNSEANGAKKVIEILKHISEPVKKPEPPKRESLNYA